MIPLLLLILHFWQPGNAGNTGQKTRVWVDYLHNAFQTEMQQILDQARSTRERLQLQVFHEHGYNNLMSWDIYFSHKLACQETLARCLRPLQQQVNCLPGSDSVTGKTLFFQSLRAAYGFHLASLITPLTMYVPGDYFLLAAFAHGKGAPPALVLKADVHKGEGVRILPTKQALSTVLQQEPLGAKRWKQPVLAQMLIQDQILLQGRPLQMRVWFVVCGPDPVRLYLFKGGNAGPGKQLFSSEPSPAGATEPLFRGGPGGHEQAGKQPSPAQQLGSRGGSRGRRWLVGEQAQQQEGDLEGSQGVWEDLILNIWRGNPEEALAVAKRMSAIEEVIVRSMGQRAWNAMWRQLEVRVAAAVAAAVPKMRREGRIFAAEAAGFRVADEEEPDLSHVPPGLPGDLGGFQVLGADVMLDSHLRPWILEVNVPSVTYMVPPQEAAHRYGGRLHECDQERQGFLDALLELLLSRHEAGAQELAAAVEASRQAQLRGSDPGGPGWVPAPGGSGSGNLSTRAVREATVRMALREAATAAAHNFSVLTPWVYQALECMAGGKKAGSGQSPPCPALQELLRAPARVPACKERAAFDGVCAGYLKLQDDPGTVHAHAYMNGAWAVLAALVSWAQHALAVGLGGMPFPAFRWGDVPCQGVVFELSDSDALFRSAMQQETV